MLPVGYQAEVVTRTQPPASKLLRGDAAVLGDDELAWLGREAHRQPGVWVQTQPGVGQSAITKRILLGLIALGYLGLDRINPLDSGPLGRALPGLSGEARAAPATEVAARRADPVVADVVRVLHDPPGPLLSEVMVDDNPAFRARFAELVFALENLVSGPG